MSSCFNIVLKGQNTCFSEPTGSYQQIVFIRKSDIETYTIDSYIDDSTYPELEPIANHFIKFRLKAGTQGIRFMLTENSNIITASFSKSEQNGSPRYQHIVTIGIYGVSEQKKWLLKQFDLSNDYFAALQHKSDVIQVFGFENGFKTDNYEYENSATINLVSTFNENDLPYLYRSGIFGDEIKDFDNNFSQIQRDLNDFNDDYNNDYNVSDD